MWGRGRWPRSPRSSAAVQTQHRTLRQHARSPEPRRGYHWKRRVFPVLPVGATRLSVAGGAPLGLTTIVAHLVRSQGCAHGLSNDAALRLRYEADASARRDVGWCAAPRNGTRQRRPTRRDSRLHANELVLRQTNRWRRLLPVDLNPRPHRVPALGVRGRRGADLSAFHPS